MTKEEIEAKAEKYVEGYRCPATNDSEYCKHDIISAYNNGYDQALKDIKSEILTNSYPEPTDVEKTWKEINIEAFDAGYFQRHGLIQYLIRNYTLPTKK